LSGPPGRDHPKLPTSHGVLMGLIWEARSSSGVTPPGNDGEWSDGCVMMVVYGDFSQLGLLGRLLPPFWVSLSKSMGSVNAQLGSNLFGVNTIKKSSKIRDF
jgi:hypothetical protein